MGAEVAIWRLAIAPTHRSGVVADAVHEILREVVGTRVELDRGPHGKPAVRGGGVEFNVAHSGELALVAVSLAGPVGIDVEQHRVMRDADQLARRFFTAAEAQRVARDAAGFFRIWTRKEAWLKAEGTGLTIALDRVDVADGMPGWWLEDLDVGAGYSAALARPGVAATIRWHR